MHASQWPGLAHAVNVTTNDTKEKDKTLLQHAPFPAQSELAQTRWPRPPRIARPQCPSPAHRPCIQKRKSRDINRLLMLPKMLYLRTACSDTLMLRERKASMADRSFRSLTGEFALGPCFATLVVRKLPRGQTRSGVRQGKVVTKESWGEFGAYFNHVGMGGWGSAIGCGVSRKGPATNHRWRIRGVGTPPNHTQSEEGGGVK